MQIGALYDHVHLAVHQASCGSHGQPRVHHVASNGDGGHRGAAFRERVRIRQLCPLSRCDKELLWLTEALVIASHAKCDMRSRTSHKYHCLSAAKAAHHYLTAHLSSASLEYDSRNSSCMHMQCSFGIQQHAYRLQAANHQGRSSGCVEVHCRLCYWCSPRSLARPQHQS